MNMKEAMLEAFNKPAVKKKVKPGTLRSMRKRLNDGTMTLDAQAKFLKKYGYTVLIDVREPNGMKSAKEPSRVLTCSICRIPFPCNCAQQELVL